MFPVSHIHIASPSSQPLTLSSDGLAGPELEEIKEKVWKTLDKEPIGDSVVLDQHEENFLLTLPEEALMYQPEGHFPLLHEVCMAARTSPDLLKILLTLARVYNILDHPHRTDICEQIDWKGYTPFLLATSQPKVTEEYDIFAELGVNFSDESKGEVKPLHFLACRLVCEISGRSNVPKFTGEQITKASQNLYEKDKDNTPTPQQTMRECLIKVTPLVYDLFGKGLYILGKNFLKDKILNAAMRLGLEIYYKGELWLRNRDLKDMHWDEQDYLDIKDTAEKNLEIIGQQSVEFTEQFRNIFTDVLKQLAVFEVISEILENTFSTLIERLKKEGAEEEFQSILNIIYSPSGPEEGRIIFHACACLEKDFSSDSDVNSAECRQRIEQHFNVVETLIRYGADIYLTKDERGGTTLLDRFFKAEPAEQEKVTQTLNAAKEKIEPYEAKIKLYEAKKKLTVEEKIKLYEEKIKLYEAKIELYEAKIELTAEEKIELYEAKENSLKAQYSKNGIEGSEKEIAKLKKQNLGKERQKIQVKLNKHVDSYTSEQRAAFKEERDQAQKLRARYQLKAELRTRLLTLIEECARQTPNMSSTHASDSPSTDLATL